MNNLALQIVWVLLIVLQPFGARDWVSPQAGQVTRFAEADQYGAEAYLAHDYLSGELFYQVQAGDRLIADGREYIATEAWTIGGGLADQAEAYDKAYTTPDRLVLQTCHDGGFWLLIAYPTGAIYPGFDGVLALIDDEPPPIRPTETPPIRRPYLIHLPIVQKSFPPPPPIRETPTPTPSAPPIRDTPTPTQVIPPTRQAN